MDFSFVNELLADSHCKNNGRPAKEPEMMLKLLFLEYLHNLSDVKVLVEAQCNLAFLWFLGLNPEETLPEASLLTKFRRYRLKEFSLDEILTELVRQCVENGLIKGSSVTVDGTHIEAAVSRKVPERIMKQLAKRLFKVDDVAQIWTPSSSPTMLEAAIPTTSSVTWASTWASM